MMTKEEILERLENSASWRQSGVPMEDVKAILKAEPESNEKAEEIAELRQKIDTLTETTKRLRAENKALKGR